MTVILGIIAVYMLTMLYISNGFPEEAYEKRRMKKAGKALH